MTQESAQSDTSVNESEKVQLEFSCVTRSLLNREVNSCLLLLLAGPNSKELHVAYTSAIASY